MGRKQETCEAISGGILVLNILYGRGENDDKEKQEILYLKVKELIEKFEEKYSTVNCKKLLDGCELLTSNGQERFKSEQMINRCYEYVDYTVNIIEEILSK